MSTKRREFGSATPKRKPPEPSASEWQECAEGLLELVSFEDRELYEHESVLLYRELAERAG